MCREIPELGQLQALIRTIFNFGTAIAIIWQIYNLILSTLGIDNPYLYENEDIDTEIYTDMDTGYSTTTYRARGTDGKKYTSTYNHTKIKKHNKIGF